VNGPIGHATSTFLVGKGIAVGAGNNFRLIRRARFAA
jgi:hypothetical protein